MVTTVKRRRRGAEEPARPFNLAALVGVFREFRRLKTTEAEAKRAHERLRDEALMPVLEEFGEPHGDAGQHRAIELPEPIDGYVRLVRRANTSRTFDLDAAEELARAKGVLPEVQTATLRVDGIAGDQLAALMVHVPALEEFGVVKVDTAIDQDKVYAQHARGVFSDAEVDALIVEETRYSLNPEKP